MPPFFLCRAPPRLDDALKTRRRRAVDAQKEQQTGRPANRSPAERRPGGSGTGSRRALMLWHLADVSLNPSMNALPGGGTLQDLTNGLGAWALIAALAGLLIGAAAWALGVHAQNFQQSMVGRRAVLVSGLAALLIGAAPPIINFFFHAGTNLH
jgi:Family of unknown function (DUF6112)